MDAQNLLDSTHLEMRWRCLSLAADLDRIARAPGGEELLAKDVRMQKLRAALQLLLDPCSIDRTERVQLIFSDMSPLNK